MSNRKIILREDEVPVSNSEFRNYLEALLKDAKVDLDQPAYYLGGSGRGFGEDFERVERARDVVDVVIDMMDEHLEIEGNELGFNYMLLDDPEECVGSDNEEFIPIIEKESLVPKIQLEDSELDWAWEIWQRETSPNKVLPGVDFSINEVKQFQKLAGLLK